MNTEKFLTKNMVKDFFLKEIKIFRNIFAFFASNYIKIN